MQTHTYDEWEALGTGVLPASNWAINAGTMVKVFQGGPVAGIPRFFSSLKSAF
jgi:hypothetical protein